MTTSDHAGHLERNRRHWDEHTVAWHGPLAREEWSARHPHWGLWATPESQALWCDPYRWIPEAARLLRPGSRLSFSRRSPLFALCAQPGALASVSLQRPQFGLSRAAAGTAVAFTLAHGEMVRLLRSCGFVIEDLIEIQAPGPAHREYAEVSAGWSRRWPSEEIWKARLSRRSGSTARSC